MENLLADITNPLSSNSVIELIRNVAKLVAQIGFIAAAIFIIWAGFLFVTARGNEKQLESAKKTFFYVIIGTALILGAWTFTEIIARFIKQL